MKAPSRAGFQQREHAGGSGHDDGDQDRRHAEGGPGPDRSDRLQRRNQQEVVSVVPAGPETGVGQHQERVADPDPDFAELALDSHAGAVNGDDGRLVAAPELGFPQRLADERRGGADHGLEEGAPAGVEGDVLLLGRCQAPGGLQVDHLVGPPDESEPIASSQDQGWSDRSDQVLAATHLDEEHAGQMAEPAGFHGHAVDRSVGHHLHVHHELPDIRLQVAPGRGPGS